MVLQLHAGISLRHPETLRPAAPRALAPKRAAIPSKAGVLIRKVARP